MYGQDEPNIDNLNFDIFNRLGRIEFENKSNSLFPLSGGGDTYIDNTYIVNLSKIEQAFIVVKNLIENKALENVSAEKFIELVIKVSEEL